MSKKRAIRRFVFLSIIVAIGIFLSVASFDIPFTNYRYNGFANAISLGLDLSGGLSVVYDTEAPAGTDMNNAIDATITRLQAVLYSEGYSEATVTRQGSGRIRIEVPDADDTDEIFSFLENPQTLYITEERASNSVTPKVWIDGSHVTNVYVSYNNENSQYGVVVNFNEEGKEAFRKLTTKVSSQNEEGKKAFSELTTKVSSKSEDKYIYVYLGSVSGEPWGTLTCNEAITGGSTFISGEGLNSYDSAKEYAFNIMSGTFNVKLTLFENSVISATLGKDALLYGIIAGAVALLLVMGIMWWRYGDFGLLADFALIIYLILMLFFLQAIPFVQLTLPGIAGIILSLGMAVDGNVIIFERIKEEYASGRKMHLAVKGGFKKAFWPIFDSNITTIITSIILYFLGTAAIKGFAITLLLGIVLSMFTTLVVTRFLVKSYLPINSTKPEKAKLYREADVIEIVEEEEVEKETQPTEIVVDGGESHE